MDSATDPPPRSHPICVATASDRKYLPYAAAMLASLGQTHPGYSVDAYLLHDGSLTDDDQDRLLRTTASGSAMKLTFLRIDNEWIAQFPTKGPEGGDRISWARLALPGLLPGVRRLLYLDADTFVCDSVEPLFRLHLDGHAVAAVRNVIQPAMHGHVASLGITEVRTYFNAGVLLFDMDRLRADRVIESICSHVAEHGPTLSWFDQDALNVALAGRWKPLHPRWNTQNSFWTWADWAEDVFSKPELEEAKRHPAILHFEGPEPYKPWHILSQHPFTDLYREALAQTPWSDTAITGRTLLGRTLSHLPARWQIPLHYRVTSAPERARAVIAANSQKVRRRISKARTR